VACQAKQFFNPGPNAKKKGDMGGQFFGQHVPKTEHAIIFLAVQDKLLSNFVDRNIARGYALRLAHSATTFYQLKTKLH
jgi:hypothetical protein